MSNHNSLSLLIDIKNNRIHIHNRTLKKLGNPSYVFIGYQRETNNLMILIAEIGQRGALRLNFDSRGACYIHSKGLIDGIRKVSGLLKEERSYLLIGVFTHNMSAITFSIENAVPFTGDMK